MEKCNQVHFDIDPGQAYAPGTRIVIDDYNKALDKDLKNKNYNLFIPDKFGEKQEKLF